MKSLLRRPYKVVSSKLDSPSDTQPCQIFSPIVIQLHHVSLDSPLSTVSILLDPGLSFRFAVRMTIPEWLGPEALMPTKFSTKAAVASGIRFNANTRQPQTVRGERQPLH